MTKEELSLLTKKQLASALKKAMLKKSFSSITVSELVQECNINRKTFYYHFKDIYDLLKWTLEVDEAELITKMYAQGDYSTCIEYLMDHIEKNRYLITCASNSMGQIGLRRMFETDFIKLTEQIIERGEEKLGYQLDGERKEFLVRFYAYGTATIILDWMNKKNFTNRETTTKHLLHMLRTLENNLDIL